MSSHTLAVDQSRFGGELQNAAGKRIVDHLAAAGSSRCTSASHKRASRVTSGSSRRRIILRDADQSTCSAAVSENGHSSFNNSAASPAQSPTRR